MLIRRYLPIILAVLGLAGAMWWFLRPLPETASSYRNGDRLAPASVAKEGLVEEVNWDQLMPADWDPYLTLKGLDLSKLQDGDPKAVEAMNASRERWNKAPVVPALNGKVIRIPGFLIPVDANGTDVRSFLLVPYFGACIHTPPPPANQIIDVNSPVPVRNAHMMDAVWVTGSLEIAPGDSLFGPVAYKLKARHVEPYVKPAAVR